MPVERVCAYCDTPFLAPQHRVKKGLALFCSNRCRHVARSKAARDQWPVCVCRACGTVFRTKRYRVIAGKVQYCSPQCHYKGTTTPLVERFWWYVAVCSHGITCPYCCWEWTSGKLSNGYGAVMNDAHQKVGAHRTAWELWNRRIMPHDKHAAHYCHNRVCCHPLHIHPATPQQNKHESMVVGRYAHGANSPHTKLTDAQVREIRQLQNTMSNTALGRRYGVTKQTIGRILSNKGWRHLL